MKTHLILGIAALTLPFMAMADDKQDHKKDGGPQGGRVITVVEPHLEFFVTSDRKVELTSLSEELKPVKWSGQIVTVVAGERGNPTKLEFGEKDGKLVSTNALPEGNGYPVSVGIKKDADSKTVYDRFHLNMSKCPECSLAEYACVCEHTH
jgi:hypothetical protein